MKPIVHQTVSALQFGQTQRYHTELLLKSQDVAQHSFNVAWLCYILTDGQPGQDLLMLALSHDAGERKTGDMPAPTKRALDLRKDLDAYETQHLRESGFGPLNQAETDHDSWVLQAADVLDGAFFCLRELKIGNKLIVEPKGCARNYLNYLNDLVVALYKTEHTRLAERVHMLQQHLVREFREYER